MEHISLQRNELIHLEALLRRLAELEARVHDLELQLQSLRSEA
jgi:hypothetical protein